MKALFRFLRGELNGHFVGSFQRALNRYVSDVRSFFIQFYQTQMQTGKIRTDDLTGIGVISGVFLPRIKVETTASSLFMTVQHNKNGEQASEQGLLEIETEAFQFPDFTGDINNLATDALRSSLVGDDTVIGYISENAKDVIDENEKVREDAILKEPPEGAAYSDFYGNKYLFLKEIEEKYEKVLPVLLLDLLKAMQWIRYNGTSIGSFVRVVNILFPTGAIKIIKTAIADDKRHIEVYYYFDNDIYVGLRTQRVSLFNYMCEIKFPQISLVEEDKESVA